MSGTLVDIASRTGARLSPQVGRPECLKYRNVLRENLGRFGSFKNVLSNSGEASGDPGCRVFRTLCQVIANFFTGFAGFYGLLFASCLPLSGLPLLGNQPLSSSALLGLSGDLRDPFGPTRSGLLGVLDILFYDRW